MQAPVTVVSINPQNSRPLSVPAHDPIVALTTAVVDWQPGKSRDCVTAHGATGQEDKRIRAW